MLVVDPHPAPHLCARERPGDRPEDIDELLGEGRPRGRSWEQRPESATLGVVARDADQPRPLHESDHRRYHVDGHDIGARLCDLLVAPIVQETPGGCSTNRHRCHPGSDCAPVNPNLPLAYTQTMEDLLFRSMSHTTVTLGMLVFAALVAMLLAVRDLRRDLVQRESAHLGDRSEDCSWRGEGRCSQTRAQQGLLLIGIGVILGLGGAAGLTPLMSALLFGVELVDPMTYGVVAFGLTIVALLATYVPARRAAGVDPTEALRWE